MPYSPSNKIQTIYIYIHDSHKIWYRIKRRDQTLNFISKLFIFGTFVNPKKISDFQSTYQNLVLLYVCRVYTNNQNIQTNLNSHVKIINIVEKEKITDIIFSLLLNHLNPIIFFLYIFF